MQASLPSWLIKEHSVWVPEIHKYSIMEVDREGKSSHESDESSIDEPPVDLPTLVKNHSETRALWGSVHSTHDIINEPTRFDKKNDTETKK